MGAAMYAAFARANAFLLLGLSSSQASATERSSGLPPAGFSSTICCVSSSSRRADLRSRSLCTLDGRLAIGWGGHAFVPQRTDRRLSAHDDAA